MNIRIQKIDNLVKNYLAKSKVDLKKSFGEPLKYSDSSNWYYKKVRFGILKDEIAFIFRDDKVVDIMISEYILGIHVCNIFYYEKPVAKYKIIKMFNKF